MRMAINITGNTQFKRIINKLNDEEDTGERLCFDSLIYVKMTKWVHAELIAEDIPGNHNKDYSQFYTRESTLYPNMRYVAIGRTKTAYRDDTLITGGYEELEPWRFWRWADYFGVDNLVVEIPQADVEGV